MSDKKDIKDLFEVIQSPGNPTSTYKVESKWDLKASMPCPTKNTPANASDITTTVKPLADSIQYLNDKKLEKTARAADSAKLNGKAEAALSVAHAGTSGSTTGNAGSSTKLQHARNINGVPFDGTKNITIPTGTLTEDIIKAYPAGTSAKTIQAFINTIPKDLGGHNVNIVFTSNKATYNFGGDHLRFEDFSNGNICVRSNATGDNRPTLKGTAHCMIHFHECLTDNVVRDLVISNTTSKLNPLQTGVVTFIRSLSGTLTDVNISCNKNNRPLANCYTYGTVTSKTTLQVRNEGTGPANGSIYCLWGLHFSGHSTDNNYKVPDGVSHVTLNTGCYVSNNAKYDSNKIRITKIQGGRVFNSNGALGMAIEGENLSPKEVELGFLDCKYMPQFKEMNEAFSEAHIADDQKKMKELREQRLILLKEYELKKAALEKYGIREVTKPEDFGKLEICNPVKVNYKDYPIEIDEEYLRIGCIREKHSSWEKATEKFFEVKSDDPEQAWKDWLECKDHLLALAKQIETME